jgi:hypothetical protein
MGSRPKKICPLLTKIPIWSVGFNKSQDQGVVMRAKAIEEFFNFQFQKSALSSKRGLVHLFSQMADAEGGNSGELCLFDKIEDYVQDPAIKNIIRVHKADEERHEQMFLDYIKLLGETPQPLTDEMRLLKMLDRELDILEKPVTSDQDVINIMTLLLVIEERAIMEFENMQKVFKNDHAIMSMLEEAIKDEEKHLKFCNKVIEHFKADQNKVDEQYQEYKKLEDLAYRKLSLNLMNFYLDNEFVENEFSRKFWRFMGGIARQEIEKEEARKESYPIPA